MRQNLVKALVSLDAVPIENHMRAGTPDINYIGGWIECKWMKFWPKTCDTKAIRFSHPLTKEQGLWLKRRWRRGGVTLVCVQVARDWFFFSGDTIKDQFNNMTRDQMIENSVFYSPSGLDKERVATWLKTFSTT